MGRPPRFEALVIAALAVSLTACPPRPVNERQAHLRVTCTPSSGAPFVLDESSVPPQHGQSCAAGSQVSFTFDNSGSYGFVTVFAVTRDDVVFFLPNGKDGQSVPIATAGSNVALPDSFTVPNKTRDIMALFTRAALTAKDVDRNTRNVTLAEMGGTEVRVRLSAEVGPID